jgi:hypothetical protein
MGEETGGDARLSENVCNVRIGAKTALSLHYYAICTDRSSGVR